MVKSSSRIACASLACVHIALTLRINRFRPYTSAFLACASIVLVATGSFSPLSGAIDALPLRFATWSAPDEASAVSAGLCLVRVLVLVAFLFAVLLVVCGGATRDLLGRPLLQGARSSGCCAGVVDFDGRPLGFFGWGTGSGSVLTATNLLGPPKEMSQW